MGPINPEHHSLAPYCQAVLDCSLTELVRILKYQNLRDRVIFWTLAAGFTLKYNARPSLDGS